MIQIVYAWSSGWPVLVCLGVLAMAALSSTSCRGRGMRIASGVLLGVSFVGVLLSAPLFPRLGIELFAAVLAWGYTAARRCQRRVRFVVSIAVAICAVMVAQSEARWFPWRNEHEGSHSRIVVIGDSVSAGIGGVHERVWPLQLHERLDVDVLNVAAAGARVRDALDRQVPHVTPGPALILLEIGGNDLLSRVSPATFETDLDALIRAVAEPGRVLVMFELPTPPFHARYAAIQRKLAVRYGVRLIPRRCLISVIADPASTVDGAHLSARGHDRMAQLVIDLLGPSLSRADAPHYATPMSPAHRDQRP